MKAVHEMREAQRMNNASRLTAQGADVREMDEVDRRRYGSVLHDNADTKLLPRKQKPASSLEHYEKLLETANEERHNAVRAIRAYPMADSFGASRKTSSTKDIKPRLDASV